MAASMWVVACLQVGAREWRACAFARSAAAAHEKVMQLKEVAGLLGAEPLAWLVTPLREGGVRRFGVDGQDDRSAMDEDGRVTPLP